METNHNIRKRRLGKTDLEVSPIGLGVMQFSGNKGVFRFMFDDITQGEMDEIVKESLKGGINWFDSAEMYGRGHSERGLANALQAAGVEDTDVIVATKWLPLFRTAGNIPKTIDKRLHFLDGYTIDLYMVHQPWSFSSPEAEMEAMADLVEEGKIRAVGVSNFSAERMQRAYITLEKRGLPLAVNQVQYSLLNRKIETDGTLDTARELGVTIVAWSPLSRGILSGKFHKDPQRLTKTPIGRRIMISDNIENSLALIEAMDEIASNYDATTAQVALNWLIHYQGDTVVAIPGASKVQHAIQNAGAMNFKMTDDEIDRLDKLSRQFRSSR